MIETNVEDSDTARIIYEILNSMNDKYKDVFKLRVFNEMSFRQIGELFGKSENWATVTFHRAKLKIIDKLEELK